MTNCKLKKNNQTRKNVMPPLHWIEFSCLIAPEPLREDIKLAIKSPEVPGTRLIDLGMLNQPQSNPVVLLRFVSL